MSGLVFFFDLAAATPIYHGLDGVRQDGSVADEYTRCGRLIEGYGDQDGLDVWVELATSVPLRHAEKFGRPCHRCYRAASA